MIVMSENPTEL